MKSKKYILGIILSAALLISCTRGFDEMNVNPTNPQGTSMEFLVNNITASLSLGWNEQLYLSNEIFYPETELGALTSESWGNFTIGTEELWKNYYSTLAVINVLLRDLDDYCANAEDEELADKVKHQINILKAYKTFKLTDIFGDIPYFNAGKIWIETDNDDYRKPDFDSQEDIYKALLEDLVAARDFYKNRGATTAKGNTYLSFPELDNLFFDNSRITSSWGDFANALILRHALRMYDKDPEFAKPLLEDAYYEPKLLGNIVLRYSNFGAKNTSVHWSFREHNNLRMGTTMWSRMCNPADTVNFVNGIFDYRAYIFFDTNNKSAENPNGEWKPYPQIRDANTPQEGGTPYSNSRMSNYWFKPNCLFSPFNFWLIRDEDYVPEILFTVADYDFIIAEIMAKQIVPASMMEIDQMVLTGIKNSFYFWNDIVENTDIWKVKYAPYEAEMEYDIDTRAQRMASNVMNHYWTQDPYPLASLDGYINVILEQRWINLFRQPWEAWALARRTGNTPTTVDHAKLVSYRLEYPPTEAEYNTEKYNEQVSSMPQGDTRQTRVWWNTAN